MSGINSDSTVASCNCHVVSPDHLFHKRGCKYRLICERDLAREERDEARKIAKQACTLLTDNNFEVNYPPMPWEEDGSALAEKMFREKRQVVPPSPFCRDCALRQGSNCMRQWQDLETGEDVYGYADEDKFQPITCLHAREDYCGPTGVGFVPLPGQTDVP